MNLSVTTLPSNPRRVYHGPLTPLELLKKRAVNMSTGRVIAAMHENPFYEVLSRSGNVYELRRAGRLDNPIYIVDMDALTCTCPDFTDTITPLNQRLSDAGMCPSLLCKHALIIQEKRNADEARAERDFAA